MRRIARSTSGEARSSNSARRRLAKPHVLTELASGVDAVAGDALTVFPEAWPDGGNLRRFPSLRADAADIARIASSPAMRAQAVAAQDAAPLYVRDHVALTTDERRARALASSVASSVAT